jgi:hypothetical protein
MKRKERRKLATKLAKEELKRLGLPRRQLKVFRRMFNDKIKEAPDDYR